MLLFPVTYVSGISAINHMKRNYFAEYQRFLRFANSISLVMMNNKEMNRSFVKISPYTENI